MQRTITARGCRDSFKAAADKLGMTVVADEAYNAGAVDFSAQLTKIAGQNPDVFFIPVYYEDVAKIAVQAKDKNITAKMLGADGWDGVLSKLTDATYSAVEGIYFCGHYSAEVRMKRLLISLRSIPKPTVPLRICSRRWDMTRLT